MRSVFDIIIPTWNNPQYLFPCIKSIYATNVLSTGFGRVIIIDNGKEMPVHESITNYPNVVLYRSDKNLGWEGGLKKGLELSDAPFVCFQNDDTVIPKANGNFYNHLLTPFQDDSVGIVGPLTTTASGIQSIFHPGTPMCPVSVPWVIFFCAMLRRAYINEIGGIDDTLPGGDDFDMCIRMLKHGKRIVINSEAFLIHHGFVTGTKVHGSSNVKNGWNNVEFTDKVNWGLINKHGFKPFISTQIGYEAKSERTSGLFDIEGDIVCSYVNGDKNIIELGCGGSKTVERAVGVDRIKKGDPVPNLEKSFSVADIVADVEKPLPLEKNSQDVVIARHILEHCIDSIETLSNWKDVLRVGGKMIIAVPNQKVQNGIPMNPEHVHAFTEESLTNLAEKIGLKKIETRDCKNGVSFVGCYKKL